MIWKEPLGLIAIIVTIGCAVAILFAAGYREAGVLIIAVSVPVLLIVFWGLKRRIRRRRW